MSKKESQLKVATTVKNTDFFRTLDNTEASPGDRNKIAPVSVISDFIKNIVQSLQGVVNILPTTTTDYTVTANDLNSIIAYNGTSNNVIRVPTAVNNIYPLPVGFRFFIFNATVTPSGAAIDKRSSLQTTIGSSDNLNGVQVVRPNAIAEVILISINNGISSWQINSTFDGLNTPNITDVINDGNNPYRLPLLPKLLALTPSTSTSGVAVCELPSPVNLVPGMSVDILITTSVLNVCDTNGALIKTMTFATGDNYFNFCLNYDGTWLVEQVTTTNIKEGNNLYLTTPRVQAIITNLSGEPNGIATLDNSGIIPIDEIPVLTSAKLANATTDWITSEGTTNKWYTSARAANDANTAINSARGNTIASLISGLIPTGQIPHLDSSYFPLNLVSNITGSTTLTVAQVGNYIRNTSASASTVIIPAGLPVGSWFYYYNSSTSAVTTIAITSPDSTSGLMTVNPGNSALIHAVVVNGGGVTWKVQQTIQYLNSEVYKTTNYTVAVLDQRIRFDTTNGSLVCTFPAANTDLPQIYRFIEKQSDTNTLTLSSTSNFDLYNLQTNSLVLTEAGTYIVWADVINNVYKIVGKLTSRNSCLSKFYNGAIAGGTYPLLTNSPHAGRINKTTLIAQSMSGGTPQATFSINGALISGNPNNVTAMGANKSPQSHTNDLFNIGDDITFVVALNSATLSGLEVTLAYF